jgi:hypothetical protein
MPKNAPRDKVVPFRKEMEQRLTMLASRARGKSGLDLYLPVEPMHGAPIAASFVVSEVSFGSVDVVDPALIVSHMTSETDSSQPITLDGAVGVRAEHAAPADPAQGIEHGSRRVVYTVSVPGDPDRWLEIAFSTLGGGDPGDDYARLLVLLFDAIMSTFRWVTA